MIVGVMGDGYFARFVFFTKTIDWNYHPPNNSSHHQKYDIFSRESQVTGRGDNPSSTILCILKLFCFRCLIWIDLG